MKSLRSILCSEQLLTAKTGNRAVNMINKLITHDPKSTIEEIPHIFFDIDSNYFPSDFVKNVYKIIEINNLQTEFCKSCESLIDKSFWSSEKPNFCSLINFSQVSDNIFNGNESKFLFNLCENLQTLPSTIFQTNDLSVLIHKFLLHVKEQSDFEMPQEFLQFVDDAFDKKVVQTIIATYFIKLAAVPEIKGFHLDKAFEIALNCLKDAFDISEISQLRQNTALLFSVSLKPEQYLLLQSHFSRIMNSVKLPEVLIQKSEQLLSNPSNIIDQSAFECIYIAIFNSYSNTCDKNINKDKEFDSSKFDPIIDLMIRDFDTSLDEVRIFLMKLFNKFVELEKERFFVKISHNILKLPWYSRFKKFSFPYLMKIIGEIKLNSENSELNKEINLLLHDFLVNPAQDDKIRPLITKCIKELNNYNLLQTAIEEIASNIDFTKPLINFVNVFTADSKLADYCVKKTSSILVKFDAAISNPKLFSSYILLQDLINASKSFNWDFRVKVFSVMVACNYPKDENELRFFVEFVPVLMSIDSLKLTSKIIRSFEDLFSSYVKNKKFAEIQNQFSCILNDILILYLSPSSNSSTRLNALLILKQAWAFNKNSISKLSYTLLESILNDGNSTLKIEALHIIKSLKLSNVNFSLSNSNNNFSQSQNTALIENLPDLSVLNEIQRFSLILDQIDDKNMIKLGENHIDQLINFQKDLTTKEWEVIFEIFHIICQLCNILPISQILIEKATDHIFTSLLETRRAGLVYKTYPHLSGLFKKNSKEKLKSYCERLVNAMAEFDMAQMRRSAGLPFISVSLLKGNNEFFEELSTSLVNVCINSNNPNEVANSLNSLYLITKEGNCPEKFYSTMFSTIFKSCERYENEWEVISAANLAFNNLLHKIWTFYVKETTFRCFSRTQFLSKIENSRNVLIQALKSKNNHCIYLALVLFTLFPRDSGDYEFAQLILQHKSSRISRIRRAAARALVSVLPLNKDELASPIEPTTLNEKHFLYTFKQLTSQNDYDTDPVLTKIYPLLFDPNLDFNKQPIGRLCLLLKNWDLYQNNAQVPSELLNRLLNDLLSSDPKVCKNVTYRTEGLKFLTKTLPKGYINHEKLANIFDCIRTATSLEIKALFIHLIKYVQNPSIGEIQNDLISCLFDPFQIPIHHAASEIAHLIVPQSTLASILLITNDVPVIRKRASISFSAHYEKDFLNEQEIVNLLKDKLTKQEKLILLQNFIALTHKLICNDEYGEPATFTFDEFFVIHSCFNNLKVAFFEKIRAPLTLKESRKIMIEIVNEEIKNYM